MTTFRVKNVKAIRDLSVDLVPGTVTVFNGPNGVGKSTALDTIRSAVARKNVADLEPTDGERAGMAEFDGVTIKVGRTVRFDGKQDPTCVLIEGGDDVAAFIDPGLKDPVAADRRRLERLCSIVGAELSQAEIRKFVGDELWDDWQASVGREKNEGYVETVRRLKRWMEEQARTIEAKIANCTGEIDGIGQLPQVGETKSSGKTLEELRSELEQAHLHRQQVKARREAGQAASQLIESHPALKQPEDFDEEIESLTVLVNTTQAEIEGLERKLAVLRSEKSGFEESRRVAESLRDAAVKTQQAQERLREQIAEMATDQDIENANAAVERAQDAVTAAVVASQNAADVARKRQRLTELKSQREKLEAQAVQCREKAASALDLIQNVVKGLDGWSISEDLRLCVRTERSKQEAFADLSPGLKAVRALELSCAKTTGDGRSKLVVCPQTVWESLDGANKELVRQWVADRNLMMVAAECRQTDICPGCGYEQAMGLEHCEACGEPLDGGIRAEVQTPRSK